MHIGQLVGGLDIYIRNSLTYMPQGSLKFIIVHGKCDNNEPIRRGDELLKEYSVNLYRPLSLWNDLICLIRGEGLSISRRWLLFCFMIKKMIK